MSNSQQTHQDKHLNAKKLDRVDVLLKEYELTEDRLNQTEERLIQLIGIGLPLLSATVGFVLTQHLQDSLILAGLSPSFFIVFYALIIYVLYNKVAYVHYCRYLAGQINERIQDEPNKRPAEVLVRFKAEPPHSYYSLRIRKGLPLEQVLFCLLYVIFLVAGIGVLAVTVSEAANVIEKAHQPEPWNGNTLRWIYLSAGILEIISLIGASFVLPCKFDKALGTGKKGPKRSDIIGKLREYCRPTESESS